MYNLHCLGHCMTFITPCGHSPPDTVIMFNSWETDVLQVRHSNFCEVIDACSAPFFVYRIGLANEMSNKSYSAAELPDVPQAANSDHADLPKPAQILPGRNELITLLAG